MMLGRTAPRNLLRGLHHRLPAPSGRVILSKRRRFMTMQTMPLEVGKPLDYDAGPLVWVDCEMTGLDLQTDKLLEIAVRGSS